MQNKVQFICSVEMLQVITNRKMERILSIWDFQENTLKARKSVLQKKTILKTHFLSSSYICAVGCLDNM